VLLELEGAQRGVRVALAARLARLVGFRVRARLRLRVKVRG
jgi:hypothetical protein